jgi:patatin-like phospholipase/acyl hydrolase
VLIDGGVIANNPGMYAFMHAKYALNKTNIQVISVGTGTTETKELNPNSINQITWLTQIGKLITEVESHTHDYLLKQFSHYHRF